MSFRTSLISADIPDILYIAGQFPTNAEIIITSCPEHHIVKCMQGSSTSIKLIELSTKELVDEVHQQNLCGANSAASARKCRTTLPELPVPQHPGDEDSAGQSSQQVKNYLISQ